MFTLKYVKFEMYIRHPREDIQRSWICELQLKGEVGTGDLNLIVITIRLHIDLVIYFLSLSPPRV